MARRFWPDESAVGKRNRRRGPDGPEYEIVGVSGDHKDHKIVTVGEAPLPLVHYAWTRHPGWFASVAVRTGGDVATTLAGVAAEMRGRHPDLVLITTETLRQTIAVKLLPVRLGAALLLAFGVMALVLAAAGLYGVIACSVSRPTREIGLRMARGVPACWAWSCVRAWVSRSSAWPSAWWGRPRRHPVVVASVPARRAARVDRIVALREDQQLSRASHRPPQAGGRASGPLPGRSRGVPGAPFLMKLAESRAQESPGSQPRRASSARDCRCGLRRPRRSSSNVTASLLVQDREFLSRCR